MRRIWTGTTPGTSRSGRSPTPTIPCFRRRSNAGRVKWLQAAVPRQLEIIFEINRRLVDHVHTRFPGDRGRAARVSLVEEGEAKFIRMANLAIANNGTAAATSSRV